VIHYVTVNVSVIDPVAQRIEHLPSKQAVTGSSPVGITKKHITALVLFFILLTDAAENKHILALYKPG
jgi:hypothetical protein